MPPNAATAEVPRWIQQHTEQVDQCRQMVNAEDILEHQPLESLDEKYFNCQCQAYINYANHTLTGIIYNLYYYHGTK